MTIEILDVKDAEEGIYSMAISYANGLSIRQVGNILAGSLMALSADIEVEEVTEAAE